jgi:hypothetical protein
MMARRNRWPAGETETGKTGDDDEKMTLQAGRGGERGRRAARPSHRNEREGFGRAADATGREEPTVNQGKIRLALVIRLSEVAGA